jgi:anti-sigma regulatory factor (Ser/Thr protein kinase)
MQDAGRQHDDAKTTGADQDAEQHPAALARQRAVPGPARLPPGFSAHYQPATGPGGAWHDVTPLPDGRIAIVVGDCPGHDQDAVAVMGELRSACLALLLRGGSPDQALTGLDQVAASVPGAAGTTVFCGILDPATGELTYAAAGHPPGIVADPGGGIGLLDSGRPVPLAAAAGTERTAASYLLAPRSTLLLYTTGLIERRGRSLTDGIAQAAASVAQGGEESLEDLATGLMTWLAPPGGYADDVAIVLYRHPAPLELAFPADTSQLRPARNRLRSWLASCVPGTLTAQDSLVAAGEAVANAIEHGHRDLTGEVRLRASVTAGRLWLAVTDTGRWLPPEPSSFRGNGIALMRAMMDHVSIDSGPVGTTVIMDVRITRDAPS